MDVSVQEVRNIGLEERLDKVILLMESQNKAWQKSLQLLDGIHAVLVEKYKAADLLLEEYPPIRGPKSTVAASTEISTVPLNEVGEQRPDGDELEEARKAPPQSFPNTISSEEAVQSQSAFREAPPTVPITSKAEMLEQVEKKPEV